MQPTSRLVLDFPVYGMGSLQGDAVAMAGGGGRMKSGIPNRVTVRTFDESTGSFDTGEESATANTEDAAVAVASSRSFGLFYTLVGTGCKNYLYDSSTHVLEPESAYEHDIRVAAKQEQVSLAVAADASTLAIGSDAGDVRTLSLPDCTPMAHFKVHAKGVDNLDVSADGRLVASTSARDRTSYLWEARTGKMLQRITALHADDYKTHVRSVRFSPGHPSLMFAAESNPRQGAWISVWRDAVATDEGTDASEADYRLIASVKVTADALTAMAVHSDGRVAVASAEGHVALFRWSSGSRIAKVWSTETRVEWLRPPTPPHFLPVTAIAFSSGGRYVLTASADFTVTAWPARRMGVLRLTFKLLSWMFAFIVLAVALIVAEDHELPTPIVPHRTLLEPRVSDARGVLRPIAIDASMKVVEHAEAAREAAEPWMRKGLSAVEPHLGRIEELSRPHIDALRDKVRGLAPVVSNLRASVQESIGTARAHVDRATVNLRGVSKVSEDGSAAAPADGESAPLAAVGDEPIKGGLDGAPRFAGDKVSVVGPNGPVESGKDATSDSATLNIVSTSVKLPPSQEKTVLTAAPSLSSGDGEGRGSQDVGLTLPIVSEHTAVQREAEVNSDGGLDELRKDGLDFNEDAKLDSTDVDKNGSEVAAENLFGDKLSDTVAESTADDKDVLPIEPGVPVTAPPPLPLLSDADLEEEEDVYDEDDIDEIDNADDDDTVEGTTANLNATGNTAVDSSVLDVDEPADGVFSTGSPPHVDSDDLHPGVSEVASSEGSLDSIFSLESKSWTSEKPDDLVVKRHVNTTANAVPASDVSEGSEGLGGVKDDELGLMDSNDGASDISEEAESAVSSRNGSISNLVDPDRASVEPEVATESRAFGEPEIAKEPETTQEPETARKPEEAVQALTANKPEAAPQPETSEEPKAPQEPETAKEPVSATATGAGPVLQASQEPAAPQEPETAKESVGATGTGAGQVPQAPQEPEALTEAQASPNAKATHQNNADPREGFAEAESLVTASDDKQDSTVELAGGEQSGKAVPVVEPVEAGEAPASSHVDISTTAAEEAPGSSQVDVNTIGTVATDDAMALDFQKTNGDLKEEAVRDVLDSGADIRFDEEKMDVNVASELAGSSINSDDMSEVNDATYTALKEEKAAKYADAGSASAHKIDSKAGNDDIRHEEEPSAGLTLAKVTKVTNEAEANESAEERGGGSIRSENDADEGKVVDMSEEESASQNASDDPQPSSAATQNEEMLLEGVVMAASVSEESSTLSDISAKAQERNETSSGEDARVESLLPEAPRAAHNDSKGEKIELTSGDGDKIGVGEEEDGVEEDEDEEKEEEEFFEDEGGSSVHAGVEAEVGTPSQPVDGVGSDKAKTVERELPSRLKSSDSQVTESPAEGSEKEGNTRED